MGKKLAVFVMVIIVIAIVLFGLYLLGAYNTQDQLIAKGCIPLNTNSWGLATQFRC